MEVSLAANGFVHYANIINRVHDYMNLVVVTIIDCIRS